MNTKILVLFTYGVSLQVWKKYGLLEREIKLYKELSSKGVEISFLTYGDKSDYELQKYIPNIKIIPIYMTVPFFKNKYLRLLQSFIIPFYFKEVFLNSPMIKTKQVFGGWVAILAKILYKNKVLIRSGFEPNIFAKKQKLSLAYRFFTFVSSYFSYFFADHIIVATESDKKFIQTTFHLNENISIIPNWVDTNEFKYSPPSHNNKAICVCRLVEQKNLFNLLDAIKDTNLHLDIAGEGPLRDKLQTKIEMENLNVNLLGKVPNDQLPSLFKNYDCFILVSLFEGNPKSLLEAMSCGKISIAANSPGIAELIDSHNAIMTGTTSSEIHDTINYYLQNPHFFEKLGKNASEFIEKNYSLNHISIVENKLYNEIKLKT